MLILPKASAAIFALMLSSGAHHANDTQAPQASDIALRAPVVTAPGLARSIEAAELGRTMVGELLSFITPGEAQLPSQTHDLRPTLHDLDYVYRTVYGEARSQSEEEIEAVVNVIYNRWRTGLWGDSIKQVVLAPYQFSVWNKRDPNRKIVRSPGIYDMPEFDRVKRLVDQVVEGRLAGARIDITSGATHYYHPRSMATKVVRHQGKRIRVKRVPSWAYAYISKTRIGDGWFLRKL